MGMMKRMAYAGTDEADLFQQAYNFTRDSLTKIWENGGSEWDVEDYLVRALSHGYSDAVIAACIDEIWEFEPMPGHGMMTAQGR